MTDASSASVPERAQRDEGRPTGVRTALILRHHSTIGLGNLGPTLEAHGYRLEFVDTPEADVAAIDPLAADLVVVLGGDEGAYETDLYPYLADELELLRTRIAATAPIFGVCLGAQMLAVALGGRAFKGARKEVGWLTVEPNAAGGVSPVRHAAGVPFVQWHGDTYELPSNDGIERLAASAQYENQAYRIGDWLLAVQFHPEVTEQIHEDWLAAWGDELPEYGLTVEQLRTERAVCGPIAEAASAAILGEYLDGLRPPVVEERRA